MGSFFDVESVDSQKWGSFSVQKCNSKPKFASFMLKLPQNVQNAREARQKFCNLYVKCDTKVVCCKVLLGLL